MSILTGHRIEKSEVGGPGEFDHISDEELERMLIKRFTQLFCDQQRPDHAEWRER